MKRRLFPLLVPLLIALLLLSAKLTAQRTCGSYDYLQTQLQNDPGMQQRRDALEQSISNLLAPGCARNSNAAIVIPVVFHVLHDGELVGTGKNISDARLLEQLRVLNDDFGRLNADAANTPVDFLPVATDCRIEFCLAKIDPNCNATTGIVRKVAGQTIFSTNDDVKRDVDGGSDPWDTGKYLNIWVCNLGNSLLGYAQSPGGAAATDGVVLLYSAVGGPVAPGTATPYHLGRTATHEVGHWLNLNHIWGDDANVSGTCDMPLECQGTDHVDDTPNQCEMNFGCPTGVLTDGCNTSPPGVMYMNYMDYTDDGCMNMFTQGQASRMWATFMAPASPRHPLLSSQGCSPPGGVISNLWAKDSPEDVGNEPNPESGDVLWASEDIWVRRQDDDMTIHENPSGTGLHYIYVRVRNDSCGPWVGPGTVTVNWAKASAGLDWPASWDGSIVLQNGSPMGGTATAFPQQIPPIPAKGSVIVKFPWYPPNPNNYLSVPEPWHFCLLAHIGTPNVPETVDLWANVRNNNNIIWRNISIAASPTGMVVHNPSFSPASKRLVFKVPPAQAADPLFNHADVTVRLGNDLYNIWAAGGKLQNQLLELPDHSLRILQDGASLDGLTLAGRGTYRLVVDIHHPGTPQPTERVYEMDVIQYNGTTQHPEGGERISITSCKLATTEVPDSTPVISGNHPSCDGGDGTLSVDSVGYASVLWTGPNNFTSTLHNIRGLPAGTYTVTVVTVNGTTFSESITLVQAPPKATNLSTGRSTDLMGTIPDGTPDPYWVTWEQGNSTTNLPANACAVSRHPNWLVPPSGTKWASNSEWPGTTNRPGGEYIYRRSFTLPQVDANTQLSLAFLCDNTGSVKLNGQQVLLHATNGASSFVSTVIYGQTGTVQLQNGLNELEVVVENQIGSPHGFALEAILTACDSAGSLLETAEPVRPRMDLQLHPNPTTGWLYLDGLPAQAKLHYTVTDVLGHTLLIGDSPEIDVQGLPQGIYLLQVILPTGSQVLRFVKE